MAERLANHFARYKPASELFLQLLDMDKVEDAKFMLVVSMSVCVCVCLRCPSVPFFWMRCLGNTLIEFLEIWYNNPLGLEGLTDLIVVVKDHCDLPKYIFGYNPRIQMLIITKLHTNVS